ncbi:hypothetical protein FOL47_000242 [Perkinsus chesapeaki]|uniref:EF-hand domain-containing protein n=1 Tax=Perkinsus chesapeaki TaxID=330153 RepID=A0A7J6MMW9_PERCH|nr:hypothetical protein FOL47_000242 [Perkinsus chesapeaki]
MPIAGLRPGGDRLNCAIFRGSTTVSRQSVVVCESEVPSDDERRPTVEARINQVDMRRRSSRRILLDKFGGVGVTRSWRERLWLFMEEPNSSRMALAYSSMMSFIIVSSVTAIILQTVPEYHNYGFWTTIDVVVNMIFTAELLIRVAVYPNRRKFLRNFYNCIDILTILPFYIWVLFPEAQEDAAFELINILRPILRLLKVTRNFDGFQLLIRALSMSAESLPVPLFLLLIMVISSAALIYFFERETNPKIDSIPQAMWFSIVTISTVGYGDVSPETVAGQLISAVLIIAGVMYMAMPLSIVGSNFTLVWLDRDKILVVEKTKQRLTDLGYGSSAVEEAFKAFDQDSSGEIDIDEFRLMMTTMGTGLREDRIIELFHVFDEDMSGSISFAEFARTMFPETFLYRFKTGERDSVEGTERDKTESVGTPDVSRRSSVRHSVQDSMRRLSTAGTPFLGLISPDIQDARRASESSAASYREWLYDREKRKSSERLVPDPEPPPNEESDDLVHDRRADKRTHRMIREMPKQAKVSPRSSELPTSGDAPAVHDNAGEDGDGDLPSIEGRILSLVEQSVGARFLQLEEGLVAVSERMRELARIQEDVRQRTSQRSSLKRGSMSSGRASLGRHRFSEVSGAVPSSPPTVSFGGEIEATDVESSATRPMYPPPDAEDTTVPATPLPQLPGALSLVPPFLANPQRATPPVRTRGKQQPGSLPLRPPQSRPHSRGRPKLIPGSLGLSDTASDVVFRCTDTIVRNLHLQEVTEAESEGHLGVVEKAADIRAGTVRDLAITTVAMMIEVAREKNVIDGEVGIRDVVKTPSDMGIENARAIKDAAGTGKAATNRSSEMHFYFGLKCKFTIRDRSREKSEEEDLRGERHRRRRAQGRGPISALPVCEEKSLEAKEEKRIVEEVDRRLSEFLASGEFQTRLAEEKEKEREKALENVAVEIAAEKRRLLDEFKSQLEEKQRSSEELEKIMDDNARRAKEEQQRLASEAAARREERVRELKRIEMERCRRERVEQLHSKGTNIPDEEFIF